MAKKKNDKVKISFVDSFSANEVTGSRVLLETPNHTILLDCGTRQSNNKVEDYKINSRKTKGFKPKDVDLIFITHSHLDI